MRTWAMALMMTAAVTVWITTMAPATVSAGTTNSAAGLLPVAAPALQAQAATCADATRSSQAESGGTLAFLDVGPAAEIAFVCITSTEFPGGVGGPFTVDGAVGGGCFVIDGIRSDVIAVFRETNVPGCDTFTSISAGLRSPLDLNCSGTVTADDALFLLKVIAGLQQGTPGCKILIPPAERDLGTVLQIRRAAAGLD